MPYSRISSERAGEVTRLRLLRRAGSSPNLLDTRLFLRELHRALATRPGRRLSSRTPPIIRSRPRVPGAAAYHLPPRRRKARPRARGSILAVAGRFPGPSSTDRQWLLQEISAHDRRQLYVPAVSRMVLSRSSTGPRCLQATDFSPRSRALDPLGRPGLPSLGPRVEPLLAQ